MLMVGVASFASPRVRTRYWRRGNWAVSRARVVGSGGGGRLTGSEVPLLSFAARFLPCSHSQSLEKGAVIVVVFGGGGAAGAALEDLP